jgi:hypothetical protein
MWETCAVELRVNLPRSIAAAIEEAQESRPELVSRILTYGFTRRLFYEQLSARPDGLHTLPALVGEEA